MATELPESTRLLPGQTLRMAVDAGFTLLVAEGCVNVISPPTWFGETIFNLKTPLTEGDARWRRRPASRSSDREVTPSTPRSRPGPCST